MKHTTQNLKLITLIILLFVSCFMIYDLAMAQYKLETALPDIPNIPSPSSGLPEYINYLFIFGLGLIAVLALGQMMIGGLTYILAAGNVAKVEDAKDIIKQALIGLGLLLVSYLLLNTINPDLIDLRAPNLTSLEFQGTTEWGGMKPPPEPCTPHTYSSDNNWWCTRNGKWELPTGGSADACPKPSEPCEPKTASPACLEDGRSHWHCNDNGKWDPMWESMK